MDRLAAMQVLVRVIDAGSFSAAARQLNVGQPAISKTIAQLEGRLGVQLLARSTRGLTPTEAGLRFSERARRAIEEADEADLAARGSGRGLTGTLRVAAPTSFAQLHIVALLGRFLDAHPGLAVDLVLDDRMIDLVEEGVDVALRLGALADSVATARRIATGPRSVLASRAYLARTGIPASPADLAAHAALIYTRQQSDRWTFTRGDEAVEVTLTGRLRLSSAEGIRAAVCEGLGLTIASHWLFAPELADGRVVAVLPEWHLPPVDLWAVFPTGRMATAKARRFIDTVEAALAGAPA